MTLGMRETFDDPFRSRFSIGNFNAPARPISGEGREVPLDVKLQKLIEARNDRANYFPEDMFADPAWDILLELTLAEQRQHRVTVTNLCVGSRVPQTTALRWIKHMTDLGWLVRRDDPLDARRKFVELSRETSGRMRAYLSSVDSKLAV